MNKRCFQIGMRFFLLFLSGFDTNLSLTHDKERNELLASLYPESALKQLVGHMLLIDQAFRHCSPELLPAYTALLQKEHRNGILAIEPYRSQFEKLIPEAKKIDVVLRCSQVKKLGELLVKRGPMQLMTYLFYNSLCVTRQASRQHEEMVSVVVKKPDEAQQGLDEEQDKKNSVSVNLEKQDRKFRDLIKLTDHCSKVGLRAMLDDN